MPSSTYLVFYTSNVRDPPLRSLSKPRRRRQREGRQTKSLTRRTIAMLARYLRTFTPKMLPRTDFVLNLPH